MIPDGAGEPAAFAAGLVARLRTAAQRRGAGAAGWLVGCYLHGSAALGGWNPRRSDVDLLLVVAAWSPALRQAVAATLTSSAVTCPGRGLECSVVLAGAARRPGEPWPFLLHVSPDAGTDAGPVRLVDGQELPGDPDLSMHYAVTRARGIAVAGPPPGAVFGEVPRPVLLRYLHGELDWALRHGTEAYAVLNALRALRFARDGALLSKLEAAQEALEDADVPAGLIRRVVSQQQGDEEPGVPTHEAVALVRRAQAALRAAAIREGPSRAHPQ